MKFDDNTIDEREYSQTTNDQLQHTGDHIGPISKVFQRPIRIYTYSLLEGATTTSFICPWLLYFNNPLIKSKLKNFSKLRCNLKLTFLVNANPFKYGSVLVSYRPLVACSIDKEYRGVSGGVIDSVEKANATIHSKAAMMARPHVMLYPQETTKAEMTLPFYHFMDYLTLAYTDGLDGWTTTLYSMGGLDITPLVPLKTATTASTNPITIEIFAEAVDVDICGPSIQQQGDEYDPDHPVSSTASAVAKAAGSLASVPVIGWYATATSVVATAVAGVARWFGFSNPINLTNVNPVKLIKATRWADTEAEQPLPKLALDPKNELTIDPRSCGFSGHDDMNIEYIATKPFLLGTTTWGADDAVDTLLQAGWVTPAHFHIGTFTADAGETAIASNPNPAKILTMSPATWLAQAFMHWTGDMVLHIKILSSKFHRGRIRFIYDPAGKFTNFSEGTVYSKIVDIAEDNEYSFVVPWQSFLPKLSTFSITPGSTTDQVFSERGNVSSSFETMWPFSNGYWRIQVMTELSSPLDASAIIQTSVYWKNLRLSKPTIPFSSLMLSSSNYDSFSYVAPVTIQRQGYEVVPASHGGQSDAVNHADLISDGESCLSLRQLLHRWSLVKQLYVTDLDWSYLCNYISGTIRRFPTFHGPCKASPYTSPTGVSNFENMGSGIINYFSPAFILRKGAINWRFSSRCNAKTAGTNVWRTMPDTTTHFSISSNVNYQTSGTETALTSTQMTNTLSKTGIGRELTSASWNGFELALTDQMPEVSAPDYFRGKGRSPNPYLCNASSLVDVAYSPFYDTNTIGDQLKLDIVIQTKPPAIDSSADAKTTYVLYGYACAGVDFSLMGFLNVPTMYFTPKTWA